MTLHEAEVSELSLAEIGAVSGGDKGQDALIAEYNLTIGAVEVEIAAKEILGPVVKALGQLF